MEKQDIQYFLFKWTQKTTISVQGHDPKVVSSKSVLSHIKKTTVIYFDYEGLGLTLGIMGIMAAFIYFFLVKDPS